MWATAAGPRILFRSLSQSCGSVIPLFRPAKDASRVLPDRLAFKPHSCTIPFRLTSNGSIESDPAIGINDYQKETELVMSDAHTGVAK